jgi:hypothetical protein
MRKLFLLIFLIATSGIGFCQSSANCDKALYYRDMNSIKELDSVEKFIQPSITKSEFYKYYFERLLVNRVKALKDFSSFSDKAISQLIYLSFHGREKPPFEKNEILENVKTIDNLFSKEKIDFSNPAYYESKLYKALATNYISPYFILEEPVIMAGDLILVSYNVGGTGASDGNKLFKITKDEVNEVYLDGLFHDVSVKMEKVFGKGCYDGFSRNGINIKKAGDKYEIIVSYYTSKDAGCCPSKMVKFITEDFYEFDQNSLQYGEANEKMIWKKYPVVIATKSKG